MKLDIQRFAVTKTTTFAEDNLNPNTNTSTLKITIYFSANNSVTYFSGKTLKCTCNGVTKSASVSHPKGGSVTKTFVFDNIQHENDGTKTVAWSWSIATGTSVLGTLSASGTRQLTTLHTPPLVESYTMQEVNPLLVSADVSDDVIVENLSQKQLTFSYTLYDSATLDKVGVYNIATPYSSALNPFTLDLSQITLNKNENNKLPLTPYVKDSLGGQGLGTTVEYIYIPYISVSITESTTNAKRLGQTSGRVGLNINGVFFNGIIGNVDQSSYKPTIKYKYWKVGDSEPVSYSNTISASDISIIDNTFSVSSVDIGSSTETDPNFFDPEYAYRIKVQVSDNFSTTESNELQIQVGEAIWTEYKDRVDFKKLSIAGQIVNDFIVEKGGTYATNYYIKYASGIMIQYGRFEVTSALQTALGNVYRTASTVGINLVESFIDTNYTITTTANSAINSFYINPSDKTASSFKGFAIAYVSTTSATRYIDFIAIGRWK